MTTIRIIDNVIAYPKTKDKNRAPLCHNEIKIYAQPLIFEAVKKRASRRLENVPSIEDWERFAKAHANYAIRDLWRQWCGIQIVSLDQDLGEAVDGQQSSCDYKGVASIQNYRDQQHRQYVAEEYTRRAANLINPTHRKILEIQEEAVLKTGKKLTQRQLAKKLGMSQSTLSRRTAEIIEICQAPGMEL